MKKQWNEPKLQSLESRFTNEGEMIAYYQEVSTFAAGQVRYVCKGVNNTVTGSWEACGETFDTMLDYMNHVSTKHPYAIGVKDYDLVWGSIQTS